MRENIERGLDEPGGRLGSKDRLRTFGLGAGIGLVLSGMVVASWWFRRPTEMPNRGAFDRPAGASVTPGAGATGASAEPPRGLNTGAGR
jgi:hypothetical protein